MDDSSGSHNREHQLPRAACCDGCPIHRCRLQPRIADCSIKGCYICADLTRIDNEVANIYDRLSDLVKERQKITAKPLHDPIIHRMPVELLSLIFVFTKEAIFNFRFIDRSGHIARKAPNKKPSPSPALLVGAVCKRWWEVSVETPQLWTDIIINLNRSAEGQLDIVERWARRSGSHPLNITFLEKEGRLSAISRCRDKILDEYNAVITALSSLSPRWNDVALYVPTGGWSGLLGNLQESPAINRLFLPYVDEYDDLGPSAMQHSLQPRELISNALCSMEALFIGWSRLVYLHLQNNEAYLWGILHIMSHAPNLEHCITGIMLDDTRSALFPIPSSPITHRSLVHLDTSGVIITYLTLPSLRHLECDLNSVLLWDLNQFFDSFPQFIERSCALLDSFILQLPFEEGYPFPPFECFPSITSLIFEQGCQSRNPSECIGMLEVFLLSLIQHSPHAMLPRLRDLSFNCSDIFPPSTWALLIRLISAHNDQGSLPDVVPRPLSRVTIGVFDYSDGMEAMDKDAFLHLLAAKTSGTVEICILDGAQKDLFPYLAQKYGVVL